MSEPRDDDANVDPACAALAEYLAALEAGAAPDRSVVLGRFPQLASALDCLEALDRIAGHSSAGIEEYSRVEVLDNTLAHYGARTQNAAAPQCFAHYELVEQLGRGGMGVVYLARDVRLNRLVALKMIAAGQLASPAEVHRFRTEAQAAAGLAHPHLASVYEFGEFEGRHYIAMQYLAGSSLADNIRARKRAPEEIARLMVTVARAVQHLHEHGLVHRDLKPSNILFDAEGRAHVTDFGLVKMLAGDQNLTHSGDVVGTPTYMAPEQAEGGGASVGPASDVYSLGVLLYEMLVGEPPFQGKSTLDTLLLVLKGEPDPPRRRSGQTPRELELICLRCLARRPEQRFASAGELADELERYLRNEPLITRPPTLGQRLVRWMRREPALVSHLVAIFGMYAIYQVYQLFMPERFATFEAELGAIVVVWLGVAFLFQRLMAGRTEEIWWHIPWAIADVLLVTLTVRISKALLSPLIVLYPLLIVSAGLWLRTSAVWITTGLSFFAMCCLVAEAYLNGETFKEPYRYLIFLLVLVVIGAITAYHVQRVRTLSRFYEPR